MLYSKISFFPVLFEVQHGDCIFCSLQSCSLFYVGVLYFGKGHVNSWCPIIYCLSTSTKWCCVQTLGIQVLKDHLVSEYKVSTLYFGTATITSNSGIGTSHKRPARIKLEHHDQVYSKCEHSLQCLFFSFLQWTFSQIYTKSMGKRWALTLLS